jgi:methionine-gamma-lyase
MTAGNSSQWGFLTKVVHSGKEDIPGVRSHVVPVFQTVNFEYENFQQQLRVARGEEKGYFYTRYSNPTVDALNRAVASLEGAEATFSFASGMAAITSALLAQLQPGDHVVTSSIIYGGTMHFMSQDLPRWGVDVTFVDAWEPEKVEAAFRPGTRVLYLEPVMNPTLQLADIARLADMAASKGVFVMVDNTFSPPNLFYPMENGAHAVIHSTTKFIEGHGDTIGGIVAGASEFMEKVARIGRVYGGVMSPMNAWLTLRGLRTLGVRLERSCANAYMLARFLETHPKVERVLYPGLESHPQHGLAERMLNGYGGMVAFYLKGSAGKIDVLYDAFRLITSTVSLGEVDTVAAHPASSSHDKMDPALREKYGITDTLIRLSVGIEDVEDLIRDLDQALDRI